MNQQTIYFLQALWDMGVQRERLGALVRDASGMEIEKGTKGVSDPKTVVISEEAKKTMNRIAAVKVELSKVKQPKPVAGLSREYRKLIGEMQALQIKTAQTLLSDTGPVFRDLHVVVKQLVPYAKKKVQRQTWFQMYRLLVLNGKFPAATLYYPTSDLLEEWIYFYQNKLTPLLDQLDDGTLDGRWAYEKRKIELNHLVWVEQFVSVKPKQEELALAPGSVQVGYGDQGQIRICGRGFLNNLHPEALSAGMDLVYEKKMPYIHDFTFLTYENQNPEQMLDAIFKEKPYLISPEAYFEFLNRGILTRTFFDRISQGSCISCGSPLYHNKCPKCGA